MAEEGEDESLLTEMENLIDGLEINVASAEVKTILSAETDFNNAIVSINAGAGGTESQDWAQMLLRMYTRWGERSGYKTEILDIQYGEEAGIKSATLILSGDYPMSTKPSHIFSVVPCFVKEAKVGEREGT